MHWLERHWYQKSLVSLMLTPVSWIFCALMRLRRRLYLLGLLRSVTLGVPVIVVGNITVGGTGKTPFVIWLASFLKKNKWQPGIVTRGYRGNTRSWPQHVAPLSDPNEVGDEAVLLAQRCACPVASDPNRVRAAKLLVDEYGCNIILSDDGLQHLRLARDIEVAMIDGERRFGNGRCLPAGPLREPVQRLHEIELCVTLGEPQGREFGMVLSDAGFHRLNRPSIAALADLFQSQPVHAVAAIGHPERFFRHLRRLGLRPIEHAFPDHYRFRRQDLDFNDDLPVIMTQKDAVKCERFNDNRLWYLAVDAKPDARIAERIKQLLQEKKFG